MLSDVITMLSHWVYFTPPGFAPLGDGAEPLSELEKRVAERLRRTLTAAILTAGNRGASASWSHP